MDKEDRNEEAQKDLEELKNRKVHPFAALAFALIFVPSVFGSTYFLRDYFNWPVKDFAVAGILATKDFVVVTLLVSIFEILVKNKRHPIRYGFAFGTTYFVVTYIFWAFFSG